MTIQRAMEEKQDWNGWQGVFPALLIPDLVLAQALRTPRVQAAVYGHQALNYHTLVERAGALARHLQALGVGPGTRVALALPRGLDLGLAVLGVLQAGAAYVPLDLSYPAARLAYMLHDSGAGVLLTHQALREQLPTRDGLHVLCLDRLELSPAPPPPCPAGPEDLAYILYTSGSTGQPKGVAMPHRALVNLLHWHLQHPRLGRPAATLQFAALSFDVCFQELFSTWASGGCIHFMSETLKRDLPALLSHLERQHIERLFVPFAALQPLAELAQHRPSVPPLRDIISAGEALHITPALEALCRRLPDCVLHNHYGPTETHVVSHHTLSGDPRHWPRHVPIGRPIANTQLHVLDAQRRPVPVGVPGELYIGGAGVAHGYLNRPELTEARFLPDPFDPNPGARMYQSGDSVRMNADGTLEFLGRLDQQVKLRGYRIELGEIEAQLLAQPGVAEAAVIVREERLMTYWVPASNAAPSAAALAAALARQLPDYMCPHAYVRLAHLPLTPSGKLDRRALSELTPPHAVHASYAAPCGDVEQMLVTLWQELFNAEQVGVNDSFFELGGHSVLLLKLHQRLLETLHVEVPITVLFQYPTIRALTDYLTRQNVGVGAAHRTLQKRAEHQRLALKNHKKLPGIRA